MLNTNLSRRRAGGLALTAVLGTALAACGGDDASTTSTPDATVSASGQTSASATPSTSTSASASATPSVKATIVKDLSGITVTGDFGKAPKVTAKWPIAIEKTTVKVLKPGTGATVGADATVEVNYHGVNGRTGKVFDESFTKGQTATFPLSGVVTGFKTAIAGQKIGSRVLVMMTGKDGYDGSGGNAQAGINVGDCLIFVIDILSASLTGPSGTAVTPKAGLPAVKDAGGKPEVTIPKTAAPTALVVQPLIKGTGRKVSANDAVTVHYRAWDWATGKLLVDDYATKGGETGALNTTPASWQKGLAGQPVGSRVMLVAPPAQAYGADGVDNGTVKIPKNATIVFVVDLLYAQAAA